MFINSGGLAVADGSFLDGGRVTGPLANAFDQVRYEPGMRRPYMWNGRPHVTINMSNPKTGNQEPVNVPLEYLAQRHGLYSPVVNAALLTRDAWVEIDKIILRATRLRLRAWADISARNTIRIPNAMGKLTFEYHTMNDVGTAYVDMDGLAEGTADRPLLDIKSIPLPITHTDFYFTARELAVSRGGAIPLPLDTTMIEMGGRRIGEMLERTTIGTVTGMTFGTRSTGNFPHTGSSTVYGYRNFPYRVTKTDLTTPTGSNPNAVVQDVIEMRETMYSNGFYGPFILYTSVDYDQFFDADYAFTNGSNWAVNPNLTLRDRLERIGGISDIRRLDFLDTSYNYELILAQMTPDVVGAVNGMEPTTIMWEVKGGLEYHFKIIAIQAPVLRSPYSGVAAIVHGTTS